MFQPGDLVMVPFPFSDLRTHKKRPVLVLTRPDSRGDFIALAITSVDTKLITVSFQNKAG